LGDHVEGGRIKRFAQFAGVAARTTRDLLAAEARKRLLKQGDERIDDVLAPTAERLVRVLGGLKGAATKLGQFVSLVDQDTFPEEARRVLARLMSQAPHRMPYETVGEVVARELGAPPEELFEDFSEEPFAAASLGQVHAATLSDGRRVVVKVQYPGVDRAIESDLKNVGFLAKGLSLAGGLLDGREYMDEIASTLRRELDYREEVAQLEAWRDAARPWAKLVVPQVIGERSAERVLTLERLEGPTLLAFAEDEANGPEARYEIAVRLVEATWGPFLREGLVHADPHPGNYIALPDGRLGVLDFGATKRLSPRFVLAYWRIVLDTLEGREPPIIEVLEGAGFEVQGDREKTVAWLRDLTAIVDRPVLQPEYDWGACRISADCRDLFARSVGTWIRFRAPIESLMFYRSAAGVAGDFRLLRAKGDFRGALVRLADTARAHLGDQLARAHGGLLDEQGPPASAR
jgi:predicted unusual protein kinase regulating ubiquinone biosynthesis (AarF/ABC1/UbiB family)